MFFCMIYIAQPFLLFTGWALDTTSRCKLNFWTKFMWILREIYVNSAWNLCGFGTACKTNDQHAPRRIWWSPLGFKFTPARSLERKSRYNHRFVPPAHIISHKTHWHTFQMLCSFGIIHALISRAPVPGKNVPLCALGLCFGVMTAGLLCSTQAQICRDCTLLTLAGDKDCTATQKKKLHQKYNNSTLFCLRGVLFAVFRYLTALNRWNET